MNPRVLPHRPEMAPGQLTALWLLCARPAIPLQAGLYVRRRPVSTAGDFATRLSLGGLKTIAAQNAVPGSSTVIIPYKN